MLGARVLTREKLLLAVLLGFLLPFLGFVDEGHGASTPAVTITYPADYAIVGGTVTIVAAVRSDVWWAKLVTDSTGGPVSPPYNFTWNSTTVPDGTHTLSVYAFAKGATTPLGTASINVVVGNSTPSRVHFNTLPAHSTLPTNAQCAALIPVTPETVAQNSTANNFTLAAADFGTFYAQPFWFSYSIPSYTNRVLGDYTRSTDMILRWAACKWGIDEDVVRAEAWVESGWIEGGPTYTTTNQAGWGDKRTVISQCQTPAWNGWLNPPGECWQSCGILQTKVFDFNVWPAACESTAFNADFRMAYQRACMDGSGPSWYLADVPANGYPTYPHGTTAQMLWGCMGAWYSGGWYDSAALSYISTVQNAFANKPWP
jgi:hypothetical protein